LPPLSKPERAAFMGLRVLELQEEQLVGVLATKDDVSVMREKIFEEVSKLNDRAHSTNVRIDAISERLDTNNAYIAGVKTELADRIAETNERITGVEVRLAEVKTELTDRIAETNERITGVEVRLAEVKTELTDRIAEVKTELTDKITASTADLRSDNKTQFKWFIGTLIAVLAIVIAMFGILITMIPKGG